MNPFAIRNSSKAWVVPVSIMALVVGFLTSTAWLTKDNIQSRISNLSADQQRRVTVSTLDVQEEYARLNREYEKTRDEVKKLGEENTKLQKALSDDNKVSSVLSDSIQELKAFAGLSEVVGPGIVVTLKDSKTTDESVPDEARIIHDFDVLKVLNELRTAGAEAISVNNKRVGPNTTIRCVGPTMLLDGSRIASPVVIRAIGDTETMLGAMNLPGGPLDEVRDVDPAMVSVEPAKEMRLPQFTGSTTLKVAKVPAENQ